MIKQYWQDYPGSGGYRSFTFEDGDIKVVKWLSPADQVKQPDHDSLLALMVSIESQAKAEYLEKLNS